MEAPPVSFDRDGAQLFKTAVSAHVDDLRTACAEFAKGQAGHRLTSLSFARGLFAADGTIGAIASGSLQHRARPVRAIYFDKSEEANWSLDWHQDRVICVKERKEASGFTAWTVKSGLPHVSPPFDILRRLATVRLHLDETGIDNAPLLIAPGSHQLGRIQENDIPAIVRRCGTLACPAKAGDVWLYSTPILHASRPSATPSRRRVIQVDYAAFDLPFELEWQTLL